MEKLVILNLLAASVLLASPAAGTVAASTPSSAEASVVQARAAIAVRPGEYGRYNLLAVALLHQAEETSDDRFYHQAGDAVRQSLSLSPGNFEGLKLEVSVLLGKHDYPAALAEAKTLNKKVPDDIKVYGLLTDAYSALGDYKHAEESAQWMLNLRPGNLPAFVHAAHLREVFGDADGSFEALELAYQSTAPTETAERAALLAQMGRERRLAGKDDTAEKLLGQSLDLFPGYPLAAEELAKVYVAEKRYPEAVQLLQQRYGALPTAKNCYALSAALELAGRTDDAASKYAEFLRKAMSESGQRNDANRELVFYYADHTHQPAKALETAEREIAWRQDIYTLDAYAWALHMSGDDAKARKEMDIALAVGTRNPGILAHSAKIPAGGLNSTTAR